VLIEAGDGDMDRWERMPIYNLPETPAGYGLEPISPASISGTEKSVANQGKNDLPLLPRLKHLLCGELPFLRTSSCGDLVED
jgi:hypothetical protein